MAHIRLATLTTLVSLLWFVALGLRLLGAWTGGTYADPLSGWFPSAEVAHLLAHGRMSYLPEAGMHAWNLAWPAILSVPLRATQALIPSSIWLNVFLPQATAALLDFALLLGLLAKARRRSWSRHAQIAFLAIAGLSWFALSSAIQPGAEHAAVALAILSLMFLECPAGRRRARPAWLIGGLLAAIAFAVHYLSIFFTLGAMVALLVRGERARLKLWGIGFGAGFALGAIPDAWIYGRPYESLWIAFARPWSADWNFGPLLATLRARWFAPLFCIGPLLVPASVVGWARATRRLEAWAFAAILYAAAALALVGPSARHLLPLEPLLVFAAIPGLEWVWARLAGLALPMPARRALIALGLVFVAAGAVASLAQVRGQWGTLSGSYLRAGWHLRTHPNACLLATTAPATVSTTPARVPFAQFRAVPGRPMAPQMTEAELVYWQAPPACPEGAEILLNVEQYEQDWENWGCTRLSVVTPADRWLSGVWYGCPHTLLRVFTHQRTEAPAISSLGRFPKLPSRAELGDAAARAVPAPECASSCLR